MGVGFWIECDVKKNKREGTGWGVEMIVFENREK